MSDTQMQMNKNVYTEAIHAEAELIRARLAEIFSHLEIVDVHTDARPVGVDPVPFMLENLAATQRACASIRLTAQRIESIVLEAPNSAKKV